MSENTNAAVNPLLLAGNVTTSTKPWELEVRSKRLILWMVVFQAIIMIFHIILAVLVKVGDSGAVVTTGDQWSFVGIGVVFSACCLFMLRPRVRANSDGVEVRNFLSPQFYPWDVIYGISFPQGSRWARLELPDFEYVPMYAIQAADGQNTVQIMQQFRSLEDKYMPED